MKARGRAAFSMIAGESAGIMKIQAELLDGAQLNRSDRLIFNRKARVNTAAGHFNASLKAVLDQQLAGRYVSTLKNLKASLAPPHTSLTAGGALSLSFASAENDRRDWTKARSGNLYTVATLWLGLSPASSLGLYIPPGPSAMISVSLIFSSSLG